MNNRISLPGVAAAFLIVSSACAQQYTGPPADLVIRNANVVTIDNSNRRAQAVAMIGEEIVGVTSNRAIEQYIEEGTTRVIDAGGRLVIPGFNDAHAHWSGLDPDYIELRYITDPNIITERVREAVARARPGELISGGHWEHEMFTDREWPTKELIDPVSPNNPVMLSRTDGHSTLARKDWLHVDTFDVGDFFVPEGDTHGVLICHGVNGRLRTSGKVPAYDSAAPPAGSGGRQKSAWLEMKTLAGDIGEDPARIRREIFGWIFGWSVLIFSFFPSSASYHSRPEKPTINPARSYNRAGSVSRAPVIG